jgi:hypothetical protein
VLLAAVLFRRELVELAHRIQEATFGSLGIKFTVERLESDAVAAEAAQAELAPPEPPAPPVPEDGGRVVGVEPAATSGQRESGVNAPPPFHDLSARSRFGDPARADLLRLSDELNRELYDLAATLGISFFQRQQMTELVHALSRRGALSEEAAHTIREFFELRNEVLYEGPSSPSAAARLAGVGRSLVDIVRHIPRPAYRVVAVVDLFHDSVGTQPYEGVKGIVVQTMSPDRKVSNEAVYPSTREYPIGVRTGWDWDVTRKFNEAWYRQPGSQEFTKAFDRSAEFIGEQLPERY